MTGKSTDSISLSIFMFFFSNFQHCVHLEDVPARFEYMSLAALVLGKVLALGPGILPTSLHRLET